MADGLRAVGDVEFAIDVERVRFYRADADHQPFGNLRVGEASG